MSNNSALLQYPFKHIKEAPLKEIASINEPKTKAESIDLWKRGVFGNRLMGWINFDELYASGYRGKVSIRYKEANSPFCEYEVPFEKIEATILRWKTQGADERLVYFNESAPDERLVIQGEIMLSPSYCLFYSTEKTKMRDALKKGQHAYGSVVLYILEHYMTPSSYDDIKDLINAYPNSVIEFSVYDHCLGSCVNRNSVIWEVRNF